MSFRNRICGMNSHYRFYSLERFFQEMQKHAISQVEIWTGPMHFYVDDRRNEDISLLKDLSSKYGVQIIGICPEQTNPKPNNIASPTRQEEVYRYYCRIVDIACAVKAQHILITTAWAYYDEPKETAWKRSLSMVYRICEYAKSKNILLAMEALQPDESVLVNSVTDLQRYLKELHHPSLKVCIDFGAMARAQNTIQDYFDVFGSDIIHMHFVDGSPTGHFAWSDGSRDLEADLDCLKKNGYKGYLSLETANARYYEKPWLAEEKTLMAFSKIREGEI